MLGKDLLIASGGRVIAAQDNCNLTIQQDTIEVCSPVSGPWRDYIPSTIGWEVQVSGLVTSPEQADELIDLLASRQKVRLSFYDTELRIVRSGYAIPTNLPIGADIHSLANYSLTFQGCGELEKVEPEFVVLQDMPELTYVSGVDFVRNESHSIISSYGSSIDARSFDLDKMARVAFSAAEDVGYVEGTGVFIVAKIHNKLGLENILSKKDSLGLYQLEVAHVGGSNSGMNQIEDVLLSPGRYAVLYEGHDAERRGVLSAAVLSLPVD